MKPYFPVGILTITLALWGCSSTPRTENAETRAPASFQGPLSADSTSSDEPPSTLTVVALTDFHGALQPEVTRTAAGEAVISGGAVHVAAYIHILREKTRGPLVILDGGDLFQGTLESNLFEGAPVIRLYNYLGVTASAIGNHEFDFGPVGEKAIPRVPCDDPQGALRERMRQANFPFLAVNIVDENGNTPPWIKRSIVVEEQGVKIGIIGASTVETPATTNIANLKGLKFIPELEPIRKEALRLRNEEKVQAVLLAIHAGGGCKSNSDQDDVSSCEKGEGFDLIQQLPEGLIDVVVAGHTHKGVAKRIKRTVMIQPFARGKQLGWAEVPLRNPNEKPRVAGFVPVCGNVLRTAKGPTCEPNFVRNATGTLEPAQFMGVEIQPDRVAERLLKGELDEVVALKNQSLGVSALDLLTRKYYGESALGNLVADAMRDALDGADIGMTNGGGLRADLPAGPLHYGQIFEVLPFDNQLAMITAKGASVRKMVELGHAGGRGGLSWSGLTFKAQGCKVTEIQVNGHPLDPDATYRVVTSDFLATGGSGFSTIGLEPSQVEIFWDRPMIMRDAVARVLKKWSHDVRSQDYYDPENPRNRIEGSCGSD